MSEPDGSSIGGMQPAVVVTGGSDGIGFAIAARLARDGANIVLVARNPDKLAAAAAKLAPRDGGRVATLVLDVTAADAVQRLDAFLGAQGLYLDLLVNNAGTGLSGRFHEHEPAELDRLLNLNVLALTRLMRHALEPMRRRGRGGIINIASLGGYVPGPHQAAYYASKAYVISLSEAVAAEVWGDNVRVTVVAPGPVDTAFHARMGAEGALYRRLIPSSSAEAVARSAVRGFVLGRRVVVPGIANMLMRPLLAVLPHAISVPIVAFLLDPRGQKS